MRKVGLLVLALGCSVQAAEPVDYARDVKPVLRERCFACHGALKQQSKLRLDSGDLILKGGRRGTAVKPGDPTHSRMLERITATEEGGRMPPEGAPLTAKQQQTIRTWIEQGAKFPADDRADADPRYHWAFRKVARPGVPSVRDAAWVRNPIDSFIAAEHDRLGLKPVAPADKATHLRRVYLDLIGLPPTREQLHAFLADDSVDAYEKVVDRLLDSPQYGERWGRHWMDVWRYSDWYGRRAVPDVMNSYPMIWRWRDWIVRSLNQDKGYDRMIVEMLAADEVAPEDDANIVATGFLVRNWFKWNYNNWMKDQVEHTGKAFLGLTMNCCQCHDHKYDPITQEDYFRMRAVFEPLELRHDRVPAELDPGPFKKYVYAQSYGPIKSGMIRVFDEKLDAKTFMYERGDERNKIAGKPPVEPGGLAFLGGNKLKIEPVKLPASASYPALKSFIRQEEVSQRQRAVDAATLALADVNAAKTPDPASEKRAELRLAAATAELKAIEARIAADNARHGRGPGKPDELAKAASKAERLAALAAAEEKLFLAAAAAKPQATQAVEAARKATAAESAVYTPLSPSYPTTSTGRRKALAEWIANRDNPLTARVAVNHIWSRHFGRPLVETTANFGRSGKAPTHPALLDFLAVELMDNGWSMKHVHRLIVTSNAYRMRSHGGPDNPSAAKDTDNHYLWRFNAGRMQAEVIRDSVLAAAGELDLRVGGPEIDHAQGLTVPRRSLYFAHHGESKMLFLELFDAANPCDCYQRTASVLPQQALALANSELTLAQGRVLARKLSTSGDAKAFTRAAFEQILNRPPSERELELTTAFLAKQETLFRMEAKGVDPAARARENLVQALFNHNDFVTIR